MKEIFVILTHLQLAPKNAGNVALVVKNRATMLACRALQLLATVTFIIYIAICLATLSGQAVSVDSIKLQLSYNLTLTLFV